MIHVEWVFRKEKKYYFIYSIYLMHFLSITNMSSFFFFFFRRTIPSKKGTHPSKNRTSISLIFEVQLPTRLSTSNTDLFCSTSNFNACAHTSVVQKNFHPFQKRRPLERYIQIFTLLAPFASLCIHFDETKASPASIFFRNSSHCIGVHERAPRRMKLHRSAEYY